MISTPVVLERTENQAIDSLQYVKRTNFSYGSLGQTFHISVGTTRYNLEEGEEIDIQGAIEETISSIENNGAKNILVKQDQFITPNAAEGLKVHGTGDFPTNKKDEFTTGEYVIFVFISDDKSVMQKIALIWDKEDEYAE